MAGRVSRSAKATTDHDEIRRWAESEGGCPARVKGTGRGAGKRGDTRLIRIDFPGFSGGKSLEEISWDQWFDAFEKNNLALLISTNADKPRFNKLVSRENARVEEARRRGRSASKRRHPTKAARAAAKKKRRAARQR